MELLDGQGASASYSDPDVPRLLARDSSTAPIVSQELTSELLAQTDCVAIVTAHTQYDWEFIVE